MLNILHLEDRKEDAYLIKRAVIEEGIKARFTVARNGPEFLATLEQGPFDVILADHGLPAFDVLAALKAARQKFPDIVFICVSGGVSEKQIHTSLEAGASDYVLKDDLWRLAIVLRREEEKVRLSRMNSGMKRLVAAVQELSLARDLNSIMAIVRRAARELTGADGATFVLKEGEFCYYADENAIAPLWKGQRFPLGACISGWAMINRQPAVIEDIYADPRIPADAYRPTFVKSLAMVPIRTDSPIGAIGNYWASQHLPSAEEVELLQALANTTAVAMENVYVYGELEQRVKDRTSELEEANRELDSFAHAVSHDLGAPLRSIQGFTDIALEECGASLNETGRSYLATVQNNARQMRCLMEDLLRLSRVTRIELKYEQVDLSRLAQEIAEEFRTNSPDRRVDIQIAGGMKSTGDSSLLRIVLENLLSNAWKYTGNRELARVEFGPTSQADGSVAYCLRDNGAGFNMEHISLLFQPFRRLHRQDEFPGTGIGLTTVQRIIRRHGGRIWAESQVDKGAAFYFTLFDVSNPGKIADQNGAS